MEEQQVRLSYDLGARAEEGELLLLLTVVVEVGEGHCLTAKEEVVEAGGRSKLEDPV